MNTKHLFISCAEGLEKLLLEELQELGISDVRQARHGASAAPTLQNIYRINYLSRLATRVLFPLRSFPCRDREELYDEAKRIDWSRYLSLEKTFAIDANVFDNFNLRHSLFAGLVVKDAICDFFREKTEERPSVNTAAPDVQLHLFIHGNKALLSLDTSGQPLHKRGYRLHATIAPIQETLAAALLKLSSYTWRDTLYDPCCGSGTILIEAALLATQTPPGYLRTSWGFFHLSEHKQELWETIKQEADQKRLPLAKGQIRGSDSDPGAIRAAQAHLEAAGFAAQIGLSHMPAEQVQLKQPVSLLISNPPYGKRLPLSETLHRSLAALPAERRYLLMPNRSHKGKAFPLKNGGENIFFCEW